jgi:pimeloyl-ACP methyl ester carboxylesterase
MIAEYRPKPLSGFEQHLFTVNASFRQPALEGLNLQVYTPVHHGIQIAPRNTISSICLSGSISLRIIATVVLSVTMLWCGDAVADCGIGQKVDVGGYALWMRSQGRGTPTVVFESGGGEDSSEWSNIEPVVRERANVRTVVYDRAGLGKSDPNPRPYRIEDEGTALRRALDQCDIHGPIIIVAHSYGGFISEILASQDKRVKGLVLVDANIPSFFDDKEAAVISARYTPLAEGLIKEKPDLGRNLFRQDQAYPATARYMRDVHVPLNLPVIDITAEHTWVDEPDELAAMRRAHSEFVAASPNRAAIFVKGSGHYISRDRPDIVINAVLRIITEIHKSEVKP